jgi:uncharacterized membrane protein
VSEHLQESAPPKKLEELIAATDPQDYEKLPQDLKPLMMRLAGKVALRITEEFSGPLPPPEQLAKYNHVLPGAADRIIAMAERQSAHRMELEKKVVSQQLNESQAGQMRAFILAIVFGSFALIAALMGHDTVGGVLGGATVLGLVSTFILGKREQRESLNEKDPKTAQQQLEDTEA